MKTFCCGAVCVFLWSILLSVKLGSSSKIPDTIQASSSESSTCYGCNTYWQPSCEHEPNTVIGVQALKVGAKPRALGCPDTVNSSFATSCMNTSCCLPDITNDCIGVYDYTQSVIDYRYHEACTGKTQCSTEPVDRVLNTCDDHTLNDVSNFTYNEYTNYFYMEYACIKQSMMFDMCKNGSHYSSNDTLYLHTPWYPDNTYLTMSSDCSCLLTAGSDIKLDSYLLHVELDNMQLTIDDGGNGFYEYDATSHTLYNITKNKIWDGAYITLTNLTSSYTGTKIWIGVKAQTGGQFNVTCWGPSTGERTVPPTTTSTTTSTTTTSTSTSTTTTSTTTSTTTTSTTTSTTTATTTSTDTSTTPLTSTSTVTTTTIAASVTTDSFPSLPPATPAIGSSKEKPAAEGGLPIGVVVGAVLAFLLLLLLLLCCCLYRFFMRKKREKEKEKEPLDDEEDPVDECADSDINDNDMLDDPEFDPSLDDSFFSKFPPHNKVGPTHFFDEHSGLGGQRLPPIAAIAPAATSLNLLPNNHLKPIEKPPKIESKPDQPEKKPEKKTKKKKKKKRKDKTNVVNVNELDNNKVENTGNNTAVNANETDV